MRRGLQVDEGMGSQDEDEVGDDVGEVDVAEVAEQRVADDFVQPPVLQQEMDVPDELNLDGCDSDMDEGGGQTDQILPAELDADEAPEAMDAGELLHWHGFSAPGLLLCVQLVGCA